MKSFIFTQARVALALLFVSSVAAAQQPPEEAVPDADDAASEAPTPQPGDRLPAKDPIEEPPAGESPAAEPPTLESPSVTKTPPAAAAPSQPRADTISPPAEAGVSADAMNADAAAIEADLMSSQTEQEEAKKDHHLEVYGFADFAYGHAIHDGPGLRPWDSFSVGNLNVYLAADLGDKWRSMAEVRFMYLPHGAVQYDANYNPSVIDTTAQDYLDLGRSTRWGGISIERAWIEYSVHPLLTIRGGQWLTPYGIWNVDHGSPVIIGVRRPFIVGDFLFPDRQTGLEIYGMANIRATRLGYHLTLSNGRGQIDSYQDLDGNKAVGGRLYMTNESFLGTVTVGASAYRGKYTARTAALDGINTIYPRSAQYDELSLAGDLKWELHGLLLQGEVISNDVAYPDDSMRPQYFSLEADGGPPGLYPDHRRWGVYGLTGYRLPWFGIMPFAGMEYYYVGNYSFYPASAAFWGGLNVRPTPRVVLKGQFTHAWFTTEVDGYEDRPSFQGLDFQVAWSF